jgi:hypothetical protein
MNQAMANTDAHKAAHRILTLRVRVMYAMRVWLMGEFNLHGFEV